VIEDTIHEKLPEGFQRSEHLLEHGIIDMVVRRQDLRASLCQLISLLRDTPPTAEIVKLNQTPANDPSG